jgi:CBS domain-containing protein
MPTVRDVLSAELVTTTPEATVAEAAALMGTRQVGSVLVMSGGSLRGIFTERDVLRAVASHHDAEHQLVSGFMTEHPHTAPADEDAHDALATMLAFGFRHLPVTDGGRVVGIVSMRDLTRAISG